MDRDVINVMSDSSSPAPFYTVELPFRVGDKVLVKCYYDNEVTGRMELGIIKERTGTLIFSIFIPCLNTTVRKHINDLLDTELHRLRGRRFNQKMLFYRNQAIEEALLAAIKERFSTESSTVWNQASDPQVSDLSSAAPFYMVELPFRVGDKVLTKCYYDNDVTSHLELGIIKERTGTLMFLVFIPYLNITVRKHINDLLDTEHNRLRGRRSNQKMLLCRNQAIEQALLSATKERLSTEPNTVRNQASDPQVSDSPSAAPFYMVELPFRVGDKVLAKCYYDNDVTSHLELGIIKERTGTLVFSVFIPYLNITVRKHINDLLDTEHNRLRGRRSNETMLFYRNKAIEKALLAAKERLSTEPNTIQNQTSDPQVSESSSTQKYCVEDYHSAESNASAQEDQVINTDNNSTPQQDDVNLDVQQASRRYPMRQTRNKNANYKDSS